jgi:hypothetical protein
MGPAELAGLVCQMAKEMQQAAAGNKQKQHAGTSPLAVAEGAAASDASQCSPVCCQVPEQLAAKGPACGSGEAAERRLSGVRRFSSAEALLYAVPRPPAHSARRPSYAGPATLAEDDEACIGMVWHVLT